MITSVPSKPTAESTSQYVQIYNRLQSFVDVLDTKMINKIQSIQHNFADQYKQAVRVMNDELQEIRTRLDSAALKQKSNGKIKLLEEERNLFREMSRELDAKLKEEKTLNRELKEEVKVLEDQLENYKRVQLELEQTKQRKQMVEIYKTKGNFSNDSTKRSTINHESLQKAMRSLEKEKKKESEQNIKQFQTNEPLRSKSSQKLFATRQAASHTMLPLKRNLSYTIHKTKSSSPNLMNPQLLEFQQIFTSCLNSIKKQLLYRTTSTISNNYQYFVQEGASIPFQRLTLTDKKDLIKLFMQDSRVLDHFYEFVFGKIIINNNDDKMRSTTVRLYDNKYNEKNLELMKRKFEERVATAKLATLRQR